VNSVLPVIRRLARAPGVNRLTQFEPLLRLSFSMRASLVREPLRFVSNELRPGRPVLATYRLRESGVAIAIRHKSADVMTLDVVFSQGEYRFPNAIRSELDSRIGATPKVADLGANIGLFGAWILGRFPGAEILAVEPDPDNAAVHRRMIEANERATTWRLVEAAAMTSAGTVRFSAGEFARSRLADGDDGAIEVEAVDVFTLLDDVDLLKIDIEGAEWPILRDPRFKKLGASAIALEYHPAGAPDDPGEAAQRLLEEAGFTTAAHHPGEPGAGVVWAFRSSS
jgi:FkbM family methyltransferase